MTLHKIEFSERQIPSRVNVSKTAVHQAISKFKISGKYEDLKRSGRPRKTSVEVSLQVYGMINQNLWLNVLK